MAARKTIKARAKRANSPPALIDIVDSLNVIRSLAIVVGEACTDQKGERDSALATTIYEGIVRPLEQAGAQLSAIAKRR